MVDHQTDYRIVRIDPDTGDRTTIADSDDPGPGALWQNTPICYAVRSPALSAFPNWGIPLVAGLILGVSFIRTRQIRTDAQSGGGAAQ